MSFIKRLFCRHEWALVDTNVSMAVICRKCRTVLPPDKAAMKIKELDLKAE